jgi:hypothetical protein
MADYTPIYQPVYPLLLGKSQSYSEKVGTHTFKRLEAVGDIRAQRISPKDTEIKQVSVTEKSKTLKKYFFANQYVQSSLQENENIEDIVTQVLDEHQKHADDLLLLGEGTSGSNVVNNGLFWSGDTNYVLNSSDTVANSSDNHLNDLHTSIMEDVAIAAALSGRKQLIVYGETACSKFDSLYTGTQVPFKRALQEVLGNDYDPTIKLPAAVTPSSVDGWIIVNTQQVKLHYTTFPKLDDQGVNNERKYAWFNFLMGSMMLEVLAYGGVVRNPCTFA